MPRDAGNDMNDEFVDTLLEIACKRQMTGDSNAEILAQLRTGSKLVGALRAFVNCWECGVAVDNAIGAEGRDAILAIDRMIATLRKENARNAVR